MQAVVTIVLHSLISSTLPIQNKGGFGSFGDQCMQVQNFGAESFHGQWGP